MIDHASGETAGGKRIMPVSPSVGACGDREVNPDLVLIRGFRENAMVPKTA